MTKKVLLAGVAATTVFAGLAGARLGVGPVPTAVAQEIVVAPPKGAPASFADLIAKVSPAVVSIQARGKGREDDEQTAELPPGLENVPGLEEFLRRRGAPAQRTPSISVGSGFFISADGVVVTNHHVVDGADEITVRTNDEKEYTAVVVGTDEATDLAVLRVKGTKPFPFVSFDRDADLRVGDWVIAVGNPFGLEGSATAGIVSAKGRPGPQNSYVQFHQIDAPINRGNSGGPTFDLRGRVVGVNSQILSPTGGNVGIGFAIPSETAAEITDQILKSGKVTRGWLGVTIQGLDEELRRSYGLTEKQGALITAVSPSGPAAAAGLRSGDLVLRINGKAVEDSADLTRKIGAAPVGSMAQLEVLRDGQRKTISVKLAERTPEVLKAQQAGAGGGDDRAGVDGVEQKQLGVSVRPFTPEERRARGHGEPGLVITDVADNSLLSRKGLQEGDALVRAGGQPLSSAADLNGAVQAALAAKRPLRLEVERDGQTLFVAVDLAGGG